MAQTSFPVDLAQYRKHTMHTSHACDSHAEEGALRLTGGSTTKAAGAQFSLVEVFADGCWGRLCIPRMFGQSTSNVDADASVICRQLGFAEGISALTPVPPARMRASRACPPHV